MSDVCDVPERLYIAASRAPKAGGAASRVVGNSWGVSPNATTLTSVALLHHLIRSSSDCGIVSPRAFAVLRLITSLAASAAQHGRMSRQEQQRDAAVLVDHDPLVAKSDPRSLRRSHPPLRRAVGTNDPPVVSGRERDLLRSVLVVSAFPYRSPHCPSKSDPTTQLGDSSAHKPKDRIPGVHECDSKGRTSDGPPTMIERLRLPDIQRNLRDDGHNTEKIQ